MKENYSNMCEEILKKIEKKKKLLLHSCCAPCSSYVITYLTKYFDITILYYNPNIYPKEEYIKRKKEQIKLIKEIEIKNKLEIIDCDYENEKYQKLIKGFETEPEKGKRCNICYTIRMEKTAIIAKKYNFDYFCTTLSVSPHKNSDLINKIGKELENKYNIKWLYSDFKKKDGYKKSIELSKKHELYRQDYCGCIYSKTKLPHIFYQKISCNNNNNC